MLLTFLQVLAAQLDLVLERSQAAVVAHQHPKEVGHVLQRDLSPLGVASDQRKHRVDAVEQEMRPDSRLQRLQPGFGDGRRQRPGAQMEIGQQYGDGDQSEDDPADQRAWRQRRQPVHGSVQYESGDDGDHRHRGGARAEGEP
jgi:hypothetical protein